MDDRQQMIRRQQAWEGILGALPSLGVPEEDVEKVRAVRRDGCLRDAYQVFELEKLREVVESASSTRTPSKPKAPSARKNKGSSHG